MGLKSSPTCELTFGATDVPAVGWLVGDVHNGIAQMFQVIENARMMVGTKATGTLSTGYLNALEYAKERIQGADLTELTNKTAPRVAITHHPDVRRSLAMQKPTPKAYERSTSTPLHTRMPMSPSWFRGRMPNWRRGSTICCCRSSRASVPKRPTNCSPRACRPWAAPVIFRTTPSSSTSAMPRSTPCTRAPRNPGAGLLLSKDRTRPRRCARSRSRSHTRVHRQ